MSIFSDMLAMTLKNYPKILWLNIQSFLWTITTLIPITLLLFYVEQPTGIYGFIGSGFIYCSVAYFILCTHRSYIEALLKLVRDKDNGKYYFFTPCLKPSKVLVNMFLIVLILTLYVVLGGCALYFSILWTLPENILDISDLLIVPTSFSDALSLLFLAPLALLALFYFTNTMTYFFLAIYPMVDKKSSISESISTSKTYTRNVGVYKITLMVIILSLLPTLVFHLATYLLNAQYANALKLLTSTLTFPFNSYSFAYFYCYEDDRMKERSAGHSGSDATTNSNPLPSLS